MVDVVMWTKFGNSRISIREVVTSILEGFDKKKQFFFERSWFKSNNLGPLLGMALKVYSSVAKELKLKFRKKLRANLYFYWAKTGKGG